MRFLVFVLLAGLSCNHTYNPKPIPGEDTCAAMCKHLNDLHCTEGQPVYDSDLPGPADVPNESCEDFCKQEETNGVDLNPSCVAQVPSCDRIEEWRLKKCN